MLAAGRYDWKNDDITARSFLISEGTGEVEFEARYFHFCLGDTHAERVVKTIKQAHWMPAKIEHLLAHGATNPEEQRKFPVVALGSVQMLLGARFVPYLSRHESTRYLGYLRMSAQSTWHARCRFLAVREVR